MRIINLIIIHCSDSDSPKHDNIDTIRLWHKQRGFNDVGYHYFITFNGTVQYGRQEAQIGAHCKGFNKQSIGICFAGKHNFTEQQFLAGAKLIRDILIKYNLELSDVLPHNAFTKSKSCPNFKIEKLVERIYS
jgi:N-acetyl-anhydromuramyl-L-alanine amidase AmpD